MPQLRDVTIHVTDGEGNALKEWGVRTIRNKNHISAYIQSITDMPFKISIQPKIPYLVEQQPERGSRPQRTRSPDGPYIKQEPRENDDLGKIPFHHQSRGQGRYRDVPDSHHRRRRSTDGDSDYRSSRQRYSNEHRASSPIGRRWTSYHNTAPPFALLATMYLDGREKPERRTVVYLDPIDDDFNYPDGKVTIKHRCILGHNGRLKEQAWVFQDIGIESVFKRIALNDSTNVPDDPEDLLVHAMHGSNLLEEDAEASREQGKIGQIVIELTRVTLGRKFSDRNHQAKHHEGDKDDVDMEEASNNLAHKTAHKHLRTLEPQPTRCIEFEEYSRGEAPWATFQFFYRSQEQLEKFDFPGFPKTTRAGPMPFRRYFDNKLSSLTPLSITHASQKLPVSVRRTKATFEEKVRKGTGDVGEPTYDFINYREPPKERSTSNHFKTSAKTIHEDDARQNGNRRASWKGISLTVVAVKEKSAHPSRTIFQAGASKSGSASPSLEDFPADASHSSAVEPPANSPTSGFYNHLDRPGLSAPKGSTLDILTTLSDASLALTDQSKAACEGGLLKPKCSIKDTRYRHMDDTSDADDEKGDVEETDASLSGDAEDGDSDKENTPATDGDDAGLHERLYAVSLGVKRPRDDRAEGLDEGEIGEVKGVQIKKQLSASGHPGQASTAAQAKRSVEEGRPVPLQLDAIVDGTKPQVKRLKA